MVAVLCAVLATLGVLLFHWSSTRASEEFVKDTRFLIWAVLLCAQSALWVVLAPLIWQSLRRLYSDYGASRRLLLRIAIAIAVLIVLIGGFQYFFAPAVPDYPLVSHREKLLGLTTVGFVVALLAIVGMWLVEGVFERFQATGQQPALAEYLRLRDDLQRFLGAAAAIIGSSMLCTGALRGAILANVPDTTFPPEYVLYYGAYSSGLLALAYLPAYLARRNAGQQLAEVLQPLPEAAPDSWADWYAERKALEELLQMDVATSKGVQAGLVIATPLVGSAIGLLLGTGA